MDSFERIRAVLDKLTEPDYKDSPFLPYRSDSSLLRPSAASTDSHSYQSFVKRMSTYNTDCWIQYPLSATVLAQHGFRSIYGTSVVCCTCRVIIDPGAWLDQPDFLPHLALRAHDKVCVWTVLQSPDEYFTIPNSPLQVFKSLVIIWKDLLEMDSNLPVVTRDIWKNMGISEDLVEALLKHFGNTGTEKEISALILTLCGWIRESEQSLKCNFCCKEIGVWKCHTFKNENSSVNSLPPTKQSTVIDILYRHIYAKTEKGNDEISDTGMKKLEIVDHEMPNTQKNEHTEQTLPPTITKLFPNSSHHGAGDMKSCSMNCNIGLVQYARGGPVNTAIKQKKMFIQSFQHGHNKAANVIQTTRENNSESSEVSLKGQSPLNDVISQSVKLCPEGTPSGFVPHLRQQNSQSNEEAKTVKVRPKGTHSGIVPPLKREGLRSNVKAKTVNVRLVGTHLQQKSLKSKVRDKTVEACVKESHSGLVPPLKREGLRSNVKAKTVNVRLVGTHLRQKSLKSKVRDKTVEACVKESHSGLVPPLKREGLRSNVKAKTVNVRLVGTHLQQKSLKSKVRDKTVEACVKESHSGLVPPLKREGLRSNVKTKTVNVRPVGTHLQQKSLKSKVRDKTVEACVKESHSGLVPPLKREGLRSNVKAKTVNVRLVGTHLQQKSLKSKVRDKTVKVCVKESHSGLVPRLKREGLRSNVKTKTVNVRPVGTHLQQKSLKSKVRDETVKVCVKESHSGLVPRLKREGLRSNVKTKTVNVRPVGTHLQQKSLKSKVRDKTVEACVKESHSGLVPRLKREGLRSNVKTKTVNVRPVGTHLQQKSLKSKVRDKTVEACVKESHSGLVPRLKREGLRSNVKTKTVNVRPVGTHLQQKSLKSKVRDKTVEACVKESHSGLVPPLKREGLRSNVKAKAVNVRLVGTHLQQKSLKSKVRDETVKVCVKESHSGLVPRLKREGLRSNVKTKTVNVRLEGTRPGFVPRLQWKSPVSNVNAETVKVCVKGTPSGYVPRLKRRSPWSNVKAENVKFCLEGTHLGFVPNLQHKSPQCNVNAPAIKVHPKGTYSGFVPRLQRRSLLSNGKAENVEVCPEGTHSGFVLNQQQRSSQCNVTAPAVKIHPKGTYSGFVPRLQRRSLLSNGKAENVEVCPEGTHSGFVPNLQHESPQCNAIAPAIKVRPKGTYSGFVPRLQRRSLLSNGKAENVEVCPEGTHSGFVPNLQHENPQCNAIAPAIKVHPKGTYSGFVPRLQRRSLLSQGKAENVKVCPEGTHSGFVPHLQQRSPQCNVIAPAVKVHPKGTYSGFVPRLKRINPHGNIKADAFKAPLEGTDTGIVARLRKKNVHGWSDECNVMKSNLKSEYEISRVAPQCPHHLGNLQRGGSNDIPGITSFCGYASFTVTETDSSVKRAECIGKIDCRTKRWAMIKAVQSRSGPVCIVRKCEPVPGGHSLSSVEGCRVANVVKGNIHPHGKCIKSYLCGSKGSSDIVGTEYKVDQIIPDRLKGSESEENVDSHTYSKSSAATNVCSIVGSESGGTLMSRNRGKVGKVGGKCRHGSGPQIERHHTGDMNFKKVGCKNKYTVPPMIVSVNCSSVAKYTEVSSSLDGTVRNLNSVKDSVRQKKTTRISFGRTAVSPKKTDAQKGEVNPRGVRGVGKALMRSTGDRGETLSVLMEKQSKMNKGDTLKAEKSAFHMVRASTHEIRSYDPSDLSKFANTKTALQLCTRTNMENCQSSELEKQCENTESLVSAETDMNNSDTRVIGKWKGASKHQLQHQESGIPLIVNFLCVTESEWDKWPRDHNTILFKECSRNQVTETEPLLQPNGKEKERKEMEWEAVKYKEYVPSANVDNKDQQQIFQNGCNIYLTEKSEAVCSNGVASDVEDTIDISEESERVKNKTQVSYLKQHVQKRPSGSVDYLSSGNFQNENEQMVDNEKFSGMVVTSMETGSQCSVPEIGFSYKRNVDTRKAHKRKYEDDDGESRALKNKCLWNNFGKTFFHPEVDHRFWCFWRIMKGSKKGWECFLESVDKGYRRMLEICGEEDMTELVRYIKDTVEKI